MNAKQISVLALTIALASCAPAYTLVSPGQTTVAKQDLVVRPAIAWNRAPKSSTSSEWQESWTENGPLLDVLGFFAGVPDGQPLMKQAKNSDNKIPAFRKQMSPQDMMSMIESYYRIGVGAKVYKVQSVTPVLLLNHDAVRVDYNYVVGDGLSRKGRITMATINGRFYAIYLDAAAQHYFDAALPEYERIVTSASS